MATPWTNERAKFQKGEIPLEFSWLESSCHGTIIMEAKEPRAEMPYGTLWFRHETGNVLSISWSFVIEPMRRLGIRSAMHEKLLEWYPDTRLVVTCRASEDSYPWLKKKGFVFNKELDRWEFTVPKRKK